MRISIIIAGALIALAIEPRAFESISRVAGLGLIFLVLLLFAMDIVEWGRKCDE